MAKSPKSTGAAEGSTPAPAPAAGTGWGTPPATAPNVTAPAGNGAGDGQPGPSTTPNPAGEAPTVPQSEPAVAAAPVENAAPGQGRVETPGDNLIPADAPTGATPQVDPNTPEHRDVPKNDTAGMGGEAETDEQSKATGAPVADPANANVDRSEQFGTATIAGYDPNAETDDDGKPVEKPTTEIVSAQPSHMDLLNNAMAIDVAVAGKRAEAAKNPPAPGELPKPLTEPIDFEPHPNEKRTDAIGSTHDAAGNPVVASRDSEPDGSGRPVYVGTAQPVENPDAGWRSNASS